jgi:hypothetical protein
MRDESVPGRVDTKSVGTRLRDVAQRGDEDGDPPVAGVLWHVTQTRVADSRMLLRAHYQGRHNNGEITRRGTIKDMKLDRAGLVRVDWDDTELRCRRDHLCIVHGDGRGRSDLDVPCRALAALTKAEYEEYVERAGAMMRLVEVARGRPETWLEVRSAFTVEQARVDELAAKLESVE